MAEPAFEQRDDNVFETTVDGVTVFWTPSAPRTTVSLQFRAGRSDEPFPRMGTSHLVEHLALFPIGRRQYPTNGFVDHLRTVFYATGTVAEVTAYITDVVANLRSLPLDRLADESRILRSESQTRSPSIGAHLLWLRYGAQGHGGLAIHENGLGAIDGDALQAWVDDRYTTENAVAWLSGEIPADLHFDLPAGSRKPSVPRDPIAELPFPAWAVSQMPGVALGMILPRASAPAMGSRILTDRLEQRLRYELGKSYEVSLAYMPLDGDVAHGSLFASCLDADAPGVRTEFADVVEAFLKDGPTQAELDHDIEGFRRGYDDPEAIFNALERSAFNSLVGHPTVTTAQILDEMAAVDPGQVRDAMTKVFETAIFAGPVREPLGGRWHHYPEWSSGMVAGQRFDDAKKRFPWSPNPQQLIVGDEGVTWVSADGRVLTVRYRDCVGVLAAATGYRILFGRDGFSIRVDPAEWKNGAKAVATIDRTIPPELVVPTDVASRPA